MKLISTIIFIFVAMSSFSLLGGEVTLDQSDVSRISSEAKKQIASERTEAKKSVRRKSSRSKSDRERISKRDKRDIKKESRRDKKQARKEIRKKEIAATKAINESKTKTVTVPKNKIPAQRSQGKQEAKPVVKKQTIPAAPKSSPAKKQAKPEPVEESHWYDSVIFWD